MTRAPGVTSSATVIGSPPDGTGYRALTAGPGEAHRSRSDLADCPNDLGRPLLTLAQLSDLHVCDSQSPARVEFLDRWADPDSPLLAEVGEVGSYRAQDMLTAQVVEATVQAVNAVRLGPVGGAPLDLAIATGDNTDNAQTNELGWYLSMLEGGPVQPDSGDRGRYEGVADEAIIDERFWHPGGEQPDLPRSRYGFPTVPGLLDVLRAPFQATGLAMPWLAVHGNHDRMLQGTVPGQGDVGRAAVGTRKPVALPADWSHQAVLALLAGLNDCDPQALAALRTAVGREVTADPDRRVTTPAEFVAAHHGPRSRPTGHGFAVDGPTYYRYDRDPITFLVLDTVNHHGGWQGCLDGDQLDWLAGELDAADRERRYVILASHHPLHTLVNDRPAPGGPRRVLAAELELVLAAHPSVILWLNGHTHHTAVAAHGTWWEVTAPSLIDWPQQGRIVEVLQGDGVLTIATTMLDHVGEAPWGGSLRDLTALAGLSRELAANDWQWRRHPLEGHPRSGVLEQRNVLLHLSDPFA
ncbi:TIGR03767 family metallophosphoesterase [soil metagenome]